MKYKEKYEKERGKPMLDFETPTYITAKESQQMQSGVSPAQTPTQQVYHRANANNLYPQKCWACCYPKGVDDGILQHMITKIFSISQILWFHYIYKKIFWIINIYHLCFISTTLFTELGHSKLFLILKQIILNVIFSLNQFPLCRPTVGFELFS